jgi:hypothetical protein
VFIQRKGTVGVEMKRLQMVCLLGLMLLGWFPHGRCEEPPKLPFEWATPNGIRFSHKTSDGGYIVAGQFWTPGANQYDFWVLKLKKDGSIDWQKTYGGGDWDIAFATQQTSDGGFIVTGSTRSFGAGDYDVWVIKLSAQGDIVWQKTYGGRGGDYPGDIEQTKDGGYIVAGTTSSFGEGSYDLWVLKLDENGTVVWDKTYGGKDEENKYFRHIPIKQTSDGGFIVVGSTKSFGAGDDDLWVLRLDPNGSIEWQKTYGTSSEEYPTSIVEMPNAGYRLTATVDLLGTKGDEWILMLDAKGNIVGFKSSGHRQLTVFDTSAVSKGTSEQSSASSASVADTKPHMKDSKKRNSVLYPAPPAKTEYD